MSSVESETKINKQKLKTEKQMLQANNQLNYEFTTTSNQSILQVDEILNQL